MSGLSIGGLASGIDSSSVIDGLVRFSQQRIDVLQARADNASTRKEAFNEVETRLITLQSTSRQLERFHNGVFRSRIATSTDDSIISVAAGAGATPGVHTLKVNSLARAHQIASQGFQDTDSEITQGTFQISTGDSTATITIDSTNNTLLGLAQAINNSDAEVTATIINDGSGADTHPYRLLLAAENSGTENAITITNSLAAANGDAIRPEFGSNYIGDAVNDSAFTGTATVTSNSGAGSYTGSANDTYTFSVTGSDGTNTIGTDNITIQYSDGSGEITGSFTLNATYVNGSSVSIAEGIELKFNTGETLNVNDTFTVDGFVPTVQAAVDAEIQVGSGAGAITVNNSSNLVTGFIPGVTLSLNSADASKEVTVTVENDISAAREAILGFVEDFNDFRDFINANANFNVETGEAGLFFGDRSIQGLVQTVRSTLTAVSGTLPDAINRLGAIGIKMRSGQLTVDEAVLDDYLNGRVEGVGFEDVQQLFGLHGENSNPNIRFIIASNDTQEAEVSVDITQGAERASITATNDLAASTVITAGSNDEFTIDINGTTSNTITLTAGTYTQQQLAQELQTRINADSVRQVSVVVDNNKLEITTSAYGSSSSVSTLSGNANSSLGFTGSETTGTGQDVAGSFFVDGVEETATGSGQILTGSDGNANTDGLRVIASLTSSQVQAGVDGTIDVTRGVASQLKVLLDQFFDPESGRLESIETRIESEIEQRQADIDRATDLLNKRKLALERQFAEMESAISQANTTSTTLSSQFASLLQSGRNNNNS